jgi:Zn finger protein HypA/HybF involved in hydrogenase expression
MILFFCKTCKKTFENKTIVMYCPGCYSESIIINSVTIDQKTIDKIMKRKK